MLTRELPAYPDGYALTTRRLKLRPPNPSDAAALHPLCADERLTEFLAWAPHDSPEATRQMIVALVQSQQSAQAFHWVVEADVGIVGIVSLIDVRWRHRTWTLNRAELAYWIGVPFQGRGFGTEAAAEILQFAFSGLGLRKIRVFHAADNPGSGNTIRKLGFRFVGEERAAFEKAGRTHNLMHFELIESEYDGLSRTCREDVKQGIP